MGQPFYCFSRHFWTFFMKNNFLKVASFGETRGVKEKIAPETVILMIFWPIPYTFAYSKLVNKHLLWPFLNCQNIF